MSAAGELRAGWRLAALALLALVVTLLPSVAGAVLAILVAGIGLCAAWRSPRARAALRAQLRSLLVVAAFVLVMVGVFSGIEAALIAAGRILGLLVLAAVVAVSVSQTEMMAVVGRALSPMRGVGVNPDRVALVLSLTITTAPVLLRHARTIREVQRMRGLRPGPRFVLPLLVVALRHADTMADSLTARGL
ncbi:energy-coupling factor transporter transmembrane component T [Microbacterium sp. ZW T5_56]|uniref:energy-coupling factor transporter transmembrane component T n=1 Tax=Microbacterium sp. ZW T5_56 TaxID=3378081 RepID=UPI0038550675